MVEPTNELKSLHAQLKEEENRIFFEMVKTIAANMEELTASAEAVAEVDVLIAKAKVGAIIEGVVPTVKDEGCMHCKDAKHPVLLLRRAQSRTSSKAWISVKKQEQGNRAAGSAAAGAAAGANGGHGVVGNDIELSDASTALVISGPNAGGKTVVLKTCGLFALMAKHAIPVPARAGARVDIFDEVMADIGDMQSVSGDLSTFSGHLVVCREILRKMQQRAHSGSSCLVLLDEIGTGTDPAQGAALAQAVLEELVRCNSRVMVTTHYQRIKELAAHDERFRIAAMEFIDNRPTYRLRQGSVGESYALEAGRRMQLPESVLTRADALLDDESRRLVALQQQLELETDAARRRQSEYEEKIKALDSRERSLEQANEQLQQEIRALREGVTEKYLQDLKEKEKEMELMLRRAKDLIYSPSSVAAAVSSSSSGAEAVGSPSSGTNVGRELEELRNSVRNERIGVEKNITYKAVDTLQADPLEKGMPVEVGKILVILEPGALYGSRGVVTQRNKGRGRVALKVAGVEMKIEWHLLGTPRDANAIQGLFLQKEKRPEEMTAKERRFLQMVEEELVDHEKDSKKKSKKNTGGAAGRISIAGDSSRPDAAVLNLRSVASLTEAQELTMTFLRQVVNNLEDDHEPVVMYVEHGQDNPIKSKYRTWLKKNSLVKRQEVADAEDGGDAVTVVELHSF